MMYTISDAPILKHVEKIDAPDSFLIKFDWTLYGNIIY